MKKHKILVGIVAALAMATALSATVFAGGRGRNGVADGSGSSYPLCTVETCTRVSCHTHDGVTYAPHYEGDGHSYHSAEAETAGSAQQATPAPDTAGAGLCPLQNCTKAGSHRHNDATYAGHHTEGGHGYQRSSPAPAGQGVCPVEGCTQAGQHTHGGQGGHHGRGGHH